jgi:hypothetical protein
LVLLLESAVSGSLIKSAGMATNQKRVSAERDLSAWLLERQSSRLLACVTFRDTPARSWPIGGVEMRRSVRKADPRVDCSARAEGDGHG